MYANLIRISVVDSVHIELRIKGLAGYSIVTENVLSTNFTLWIFDWIYSRHWFCLFFNSQLHLIQAMKMTLIFKTMPHSTPSVPGATQSDRVICKIRSNWLLHLKTLQSNILAPQTIRSRTFWMPMTQLLWTNSKISSCLIRCTFEFPWQKKY